MLTSHLGYVTEEGLRNRYTHMIGRIEAWLTSAKIGATRHHPCVTAPPLSLEVSELALI